MADGLWQSTMVVRSAWWRNAEHQNDVNSTCLLYTSDAADE